MSVLVIQMSGDELSPAAESHRVSLGAGVAETEVCGLLSSDTFPVQGVLGIYLEVNQRNGGSMVKSTD